MPRRPRCDYFDEGERDLIIAALESHRDSYDSFLSDSEGDDVLLELARRCEREEPSRELDSAIDLALNPDAEVWSPEWYSGAPNDFLLWPDLPDGAAKYRQIERYTTSLDAAVRLVPDEGIAWWEINMEPSGIDSAGARAEVVFDGEYPDCRALHARSAALALCAAALRARAALSKAIRDEGLASPSSIEI